MSWGRLATHHALPSSLRGPSQRGGICQAGAATDLVLLLLLLFFLVFLGGSSLALLFLFSSTSSFFLCFSFFFSFLSFSFFFGLFCWGCESAASCSCTALSYGADKQDTLLS